MGILNSWGREKLNTHELREVPHEMRKKNEDTTEGTKFSKIVKKNWRNLSAMRTNMGKMKRRRIECERKREAYTKHLYCLKNGPI